MSEAVAEALPAPVLDAASVLEAEAALEEVPVAELEDVEEILVVEAEVEVLVVWVMVLRVEGLEVVVGASVVVEALEELGVVDEALALLAVELSVAVAPETLKRGK